MMDFIVGNTYEVTALGFNRRPISTWFFYIEKNDNGNLAIKLTSISLSETFYSKDYTVDIINSYIDEGIWEVKWLAPKIELDNDLFRME